MLQLTPTLMELIEAGLKMKLIEEKWSKCFGKNKGIKIEVGKNHKQNESKYAFRPTCSSFFTCCPIFLVIDFSLY